MSAEMHPMIEDRLLRKRDVAEMFGVSTRTIDRRVNEGKLSRVKILGMIRFRLSEVQALMRGGNHDLQS